MKKIHFSSIVFKIKEIDGELEQDLKIVKNPKDIDKAIENRIKDLFDYIADDEILGEERFNFIIEHLKTPCNLLHA